MLSCVQEVLALRKLAVVALKVILVQAACVTYAPNTTEHLVTAGIKSFEAGDYSQAIVAFQRALQSYSRKNKSESENVAHCYYLIARCNFQQKDLQQALLNLESSKKIYRAIGKWERLAICLNDVGIVSQALSNLNGALEAYRAALEIYLQLGLERDAAQQHLNIS